MKERPILFSTHMVQAILDGRKTQTRRIIKPQPIFENGWWKYGKNYENWSNHGPNEPLFECSSPYGNTGDLLWVRETWQAGGAFGLYGRKQYKADYKNGINPSGLNWKPSIFMPKEAARIWLEITDVNVERLQDIDWKDAYNEGVEIKSMFPMAVGDCIRAFQTLWQSINGPDSWNQNPWVWVVKFKVLSTTGKPVTSIQQPETTNQP